MVRICRLISRNIEKFKHLFFRISLLVNTTDIHNLYYQLEEWRKQTDYVIAKKKKKKGKIKKNPQNTPLHVFNVSYKIIYQISRW